MKVRQNIVVVVVVFHGKKDRKPYGMERVKT